MLKATEETGRVVTGSRLFGVAVVLSIIGVESAWLAALGGLVIRAVG